jgi:terminase, large subunit
VIGKPTEIEVNYKGQRIKRGARVWPVGTDTAKAIIYSELRVQQVGPGYRHFSRHTPGYVYEQLTAERLVTRYHKGRPKLEWLKPAGRRNEALDCTVYSLVCEHYLGVPKFADHHWATLEGRLRQPDLLDQPAQPAVKSQPEIDATAHEPAAQPDPAAPRKTAPPPQRPMPRRIGRIGGFK